MIGRSDLLVTCFTAIQVQICIDKRKESVMGTSGQRLELEIQRRNFMGSVLFRIKSALGNVR